MTKSTTGFSGFDGINHKDQREAGGGNQFSLEPPDQGLCVGNGFVVESVNDALQIYDTSGTPQPPGVITLSQFYRLPPTINRTTGVFGPFLSDPKCYYDPDTGGHWFHSVLEIDQSPQTGAFQNHAAVLLAVSTSNSPTGTWNLYEIDATDSGHANCPCFGDQPLIGADQYGFYVSTAEYDLKPFGAHFNGPQIYAMDKVALEGGTLPTVVHIADLGDSSGTVQPATSPNGVYRISDNGTEFFMSGYDTLPPDGRLRPGQFDKLDVWGLINTNTLQEASPTVALSKMTLTSEVYGQPPPQFQKDGTRPLGDSLGEPNPDINSNDDRMNQVVFAADKLWGGINTIIGGEAVPRTGIGWFIVTPGISSAGLVTASISQQGYIAVAKSHVSFPSIGVNDAGQGAVVFTLMSPKDFPSFAYASISLAGLGTSVHLAQPGSLPEDGFTCYPEFAGGGTCRWGDYSAAVASGSGIWMATEYVSSADRTVNANWGTFVGRLAP